MESEIDFDKLLKTWPFGLIGRILKHLAINYSGFSTPAKFLGEIGKPGASTFSQFSDLIDVRGYVCWHSPVNVEQLDSECFWEHSIFPSPFSQGLTIQEKKEFQVFSSKVLSFITVLIFVAETRNYFIAYFIASRFYQTAVENLSHFSLMNFASGNI